MPTIRLLDINVGADYVAGYPGRVDNIEAVRRAAKASLVVTTESGPESDAELLSREFGWRSAFARRGGYAPIATAVHWDPEKYKFVRAWQFVTLPGSTHRWGELVKLLHRSSGENFYVGATHLQYLPKGPNTVRKYDRVLQVGTQQRSMAMNRVACDLVRSGGLGKVLEVRAINYGGAEASPNPYPAGQPVPEGLDWNMWLNQAADRPFQQDWMGWMRWRDFAGGEMTNWGAHGVDQIQWALGMDDTGPVELTPLSAGPNGQVSMRYANGVTVKFIIEPGKGPMGGAVFVCEKGKLEINRNKFSSNPPEIAVELSKQVDVAEEERKWSDELALWQARWHMQDWLDCIRSRKTPVADVEIGHRSVSVCHLANITRAAGRPLRWDPTAEKFVGDDKANAYLDRERRAGFEDARRAWLVREHASDFDQRQWPGGRRRLPRRCGREAGRPSAGWSAARRQGHSI